jgi:hypothetical protein
MSTQKNHKSDFVQFSRAEDNHIAKVFAHTVEESTAIRLAEKVSKPINRPTHIIIQRAFQLGLLPYQEFAHWLLSHRENGWRSDEIEFLIANPDTSRKKLAVVLGRTVQSVSKQCFELKLNNGGYLYSWSPSDLMMLKRSYQTLNIKELSKTLGRCSIDIKHKMLELGLVDKQNYVQFTGRPIKAYS